MKLVEEHYRDDRTRGQTKTHNCIVFGTDKGMSGWGGAINMRSIAGWACRWKDVDTVEAWVRNRSDITRISITKDEIKKYPSDDIHIYVVEDGHPALQG